MRSQRVLCGFVIALLTVSGCARSAAESATQILGRWQRAGEPRLGEPNLFAEYVEFRQGGQLVILGGDTGSGRVWMIGQAQYEFPAGNQMKFTGNCWRGYESYKCSRTYDLLLLGDYLKISDGQSADKKVEYTRVAPLSPGLPPTLAPPFPSPTPGAGG